MGIIYLHLHNNEFVKISVTHFILKFSFLKRAFSIQYLIVLVLQLPEPYALRRPSIK